MEDFQLADAMRIRYSQEKQEIYNMLSSLFYRIIENDSQGREHGRGICISICTYLDNPSEGGIHQIERMGINQKTSKEIRDISRFIQMTGESQEDIRDFIDEILKYLSNKLLNQVLGKRSTIEKKVYTLLAA
ncbi:MAG: hypothetical protein PHY14_00555 [Candidatus Gracilibacteria bacterium]|nr:hypothetical protein [Candidatus Gracilibacteria bacterium]